MKKNWTVLFAAAIVCAAPILNAKEYLFDFGTKDSPVAEGFTKVTEEDVFAAEKEYGFFFADTKKKYKLFSRDENFSKQTESLKLGPIFCDHVTAGRKLWYPEINYGFKMKLPQGEYYGAVIMGKMLEFDANTIAEPPYWFTDSSVKVNGKTVAEVSHGGGNLKKYMCEFFSITEDNFFPGDSLFKKYVLPHFPVHFFSFSGTELNIETNAFCPINALLIYPKDQEKELKSKLNALLENEREIVDSQYKEKVPEKETLSESLKSKYLKDGAILFTRSSEEEITSYTMPEEKEAMRPAGDFIPPGETGMIRFNILPLKELKNAQISLSEFKSKDGNVISKDNLSLWLSHYVAFPSGIGGGGVGFIYKIRPWYAYQYKPQTLKNMATRMFSVYAKVPENTKAGDYSGTVTLSSPDIPKPLNLPLMIKVMPFKLQKEDVTFGMYDYSPGSTLVRLARDNKKLFGTQARAMVAEFEEKLHREMSDNGYNTVAQGPSGLTLDKNGNIVETEAWDLWCDFMNIYKKYYGSTPLPSYGTGWSLLGTSSVPGYWGIHEYDKWEKEGWSEKTVSDIEKIVSYFYKKGKELKWPEIIFYVQDEMANYGTRGGKMAKARAELFQKLGKKIGFRTCASMNGAVELPEIPYLNISIPNGALPLSEKNIKYMKDNGSEFWIYNIGANRYTFGYYLTKAQAKGRLQWSFSAASRYLDQIPTLPSLGSIVYTTVFDGNLNISKRWDVENMRQGIIDYKYFLTMKKLVDKNKKSSSPKMKEAVARAEKLMAKMFEGIDLETIDKRTSLGIWNETTCQRLRWKIASSIKEMNDAE
ncbi:MAG: hypothetical protein A2017_11635 [Lentisphaerae bacterium GWF2_44_16]|nr:MAG: hypothetical protein A2017_11635 [Lentisphaerae bacterium GWF2_44_16]